MKPMQSCSEPEPYDQQVATFHVSPELERCLAELEERIDPAVEEQLHADYVTFLNGDWPEPLFAPQRPPAASARDAWAAIPINEALGDLNKMALQQVSGCHRLLDTCSGAPLAVRANYGVCISSAWYGCRLLMMDDELNTLPTSLPLEGRTQIDDLIATGVPDVTAGYGARVFAMGKLFRDLLAAYPRIQRYVHVYHPDFQSPIDTAELVWGSDLLLALYEAPEQVHRFLNLLTDTYIDAMHTWSDLHPFAPEINAHWSFLHKGNIALRTDSGMNLSPAMYDEFVRPYEQRCLDACGGGIIHFCGRGDHFIASMTAQRGMHGIAMSQPHLNDMEIIYRNTVDRGIPLLKFDRATALDALSAGRDLHHRVLTLPA